jgi:transcription elongation factor Elf1
MQCIICGQETSKEGGFTFFNKKDRTINRICGICLRKHGSNLNSSLEDLLYKKVFSQIKR